MLVLAILVVLVAGCDDDFTPLQPNELQFSIYGYLDASADTQWIRVMPLRPLIVSSPEPTGATVTLERIGSDRPIELRDSIFRFSPGADIGSDGIFLNNFWTTEPIEPGASYRFSARRDGEAASEAVVEVPPDYEVEIWLRQDLTPGPDVVRIVGLTNLAYVEVATHYEDDCGSGIARVFVREGAGDLEEMRVPIARTAPRAVPCGTMFIEKREVHIVGSGAPWPDGPDGSPARLGATDVPSNITQALGFLGGVLTKGAPYEHCVIDVIPRSSDYCRLRYDATSATFRGSVWDQCTALPVVGADVWLDELEPVQPEQPLIRFAATNRSGEFSIGALVSGRRYALRIQATSPDPLNPYAAFTDMLVFSAGEQRDFVASLHRVRPC